MSTPEWISTNRAWWDERAPLHERSEFYDLEGFRSGVTSDRLRPFELDELGVEPEGLDLVHLQCHIGTDTLSWARHGAHVVGLDFSATAVAAAHRLAHAANLRDRAEFVASDVYDAAAALDGRVF